MSVTKEQLAKLNPGDIIVAQRTLKVVGHKHEWYDEAVLVTEDVADGSEVIYFAKDEAKTSLYLGMVKKARRQFKEGDTITGRELKDHMWKRGTIVSYPPTGGTWYLTAKGTWRDVKYDKHAYPFAEFHDGDSFILKHIEK